MKVYKLKHTSKIYILCCELGSRCTNNHNVDTNNSSLATTDSVTHPLTSAFPLSPPPSAGYGGGSEDVKEYVKAEEVGRREGGCEARYSSCPYPLASMVESALSHLHTGLAQAASLPIT